MVTEDQVEEAMNYLIESAEEYARWRSEEKMLENKLKIVEASEFRAQTSGAVDAKRMNARASQAYKEVSDELYHASIKYHTIQAKREAYKTLVSLYQTQQKREGY